MKQYQKSWHTLELKIREINMASCFEDENENLCAQLVQQDKALENLKAEIEDCKKAKVEYLEIIMQLQSQGKFLKRSAQIPRLIQIEIKALNTLIANKDKDVKLLHMELAKQSNHDLGNVKVKNEETDLIATWKVLNSAVTDVQGKCDKVRQINACMNFEIKDQKLKAKEISDAFKVADLDLVIQESIMLKSKLNEEILNKKLAQKDTKIHKKQAKQQSNSNTTQLESLERPLKYLKRNKKQLLSTPYCQAYLRKLVLTLLETLLVKEKLVNNTIAQNVTLASRLETLTGVPEPYDPSDQVPVDSRKKDANPIA